LAPRLVRQWEVELAEQSAMGLAQLLVQKLATKSGHRLELESVCKLEAALAVEWESQLAWGLALKSVVGWGVE